MSFTHKANGGKVSPTSSYRLPACLNLVPGGVEYYPTVQPSKKTTPAAATADTTKKNGQHQHQQHHQNQHRSNNCDTTSKTLQHMYNLESMKPSTLVRKAKIADSILRKYTLHFAEIEREGEENKTQQRKEQKGREKNEGKDAEEKEDEKMKEFEEEGQNDINDKSSPLSSSSVQLPYYLPSLSVLAESAFGSLSGVSPGKVRGWADAMVLAYLEDDEDDDFDESEDNGKGRKRENSATNDTIDIGLMERFSTLSSTLPANGSNTRNGVAAMHGSSSSSPASPFSSSSPALTPRTMSTFCDLPSTLRSLHKSQIDPSSPPFFPRGNGNSNNNRINNNSTRKRNDREHDQGEQEQQQQPSLPRRSCGYVFRQGDIAWNCRTCQADATCVLCDDCFRNSDHTGHEVFFHRTTPGGCCDCGDVEAWDPRGCCDLHRPVATDYSSESDDEKAKNVLENWSDDTNGKEKMDIGKTILSEVNGKLHELKEGDTNHLNQPTNGSFSTSSSSNPAVSSSSSPKSPSNFMASIDDFDAVRASRKGRDDGDRTVRISLPPIFAAAIGVVVGAAVNCTVHAADGAGISADLSQWERRWADQVRKISDGVHVEEAYCSYFDNVPDVTRATAAISRVGGGEEGINPRQAVSLGSIVSRTLPPGYCLHLRLHNDDIHTFDEVITTLYELPGIHSNDIINNTGGADDDDDDDDEEEADEALIDFEGDESNGVHHDRRPRPTNHLEATPPGLIRAPLPKSVPETFTKYGLVSTEDAANDLTHRVDSDGQVVVRTYHTFAGARAGFLRCRERGLQCAVVSDPQLVLEERATELLGWLSDVSAAHPAAAALVVQALVDVTGGVEGSTIGNCCVWGESRFIPPWAGMRLVDSKSVHNCVTTSLTSSPSLNGSSTYTSMVPRWRRAMDAFPPHRRASYLNREEAERLHYVGLGRCNSLDSSITICSPDEFRKVTGVDPYFYEFRSRISYRLPSERLRKSPHALWGTMPSPLNPGHGRISHPCLHSSLSSHDDNDDDLPRILEPLLVLDTDLRKQHEADSLITSPFPHRLMGLHMVSGVGLTIIGGGEDIFDSTLPSIARPLPPTEKDWSLLLSASSFRSPASPVLLLLLLDPYPPKAFRSALHTLFLPLLVDSRFRTRFAASLGGAAYRPLSTLFCAGVGTEIDTPLGFTVQILTAGSLVRALGNTEVMQKLLSHDGMKKNKDNVTATNEDVVVMPITLTIMRCIHSNLLGATELVRMVLKNTCAGNVDDTAATQDIDSMNDSRQKSNNALLAAITYRFREHPLTTTLPAAPDDGFLDSRSTKHKRLPHLVRDLEYIFETPGTALRLLLNPTLPPGPPVAIKTSLSNGTKQALDFPEMWSRLLRLGQGMDLQKRKINGGHVEYESSRWMEAFSLTVNFAGARDALCHSQSNHIPNVGMPGLDTVRKATGNLLAALLREIKRWLYNEDKWGSGFPVPLLSNAALLGMSEMSKLEGLQRSTLHVSSRTSAFSPIPTSSVPSSSSSFSEDVATTLALDCALQIKMPEAQLKKIEEALHIERGSRQNTDGSSCGPMMADWLRVPHSPLVGDSLSFHIPLHRAIARSIKCLCSVIVSESNRKLDDNWWKLPVLDMVSETARGVSEEQPLNTLILPVLRTSNCRIIWAGEPECDTQEAQKRRARSRSVSAAIASAKIVHSLCDHPLRCLVAAEQTTRHLWRRNGMAVNAMAINYTSVPLARSFRDLDLTMVQLSASGMSIGLGARRVFSLILNRFNMDGYLCDPERRNGGRGPASLGGINWVNPPRLQDPDHAIVLTEIFFSTICSLVTELPALPPLSRSDNSALYRNLRRELVHALAAKPRSHSEAMEASSGAISRKEESDGGGGSSFRKVFSKVLGEIGQQKNQGSRSNGPPLFELKAEFSNDYDPTFSHLHRSDHQHAMDNIVRLRKLNYTKQSGNKTKSMEMCLPVVQTPPLSHPRFVSCRLILHLPALDAAIRRSLLVALTGGHWLPPQEPSKDVKDQDLLQPSESSTEAGYVKTAPTFNFQGVNRTSRDKSKTPFSIQVVADSPVSFIEVLQVLTLQIHTLEECAYLHQSLPGLDYEGKALSASLSINSYLSRLVHTPDSLIDIWALRCAPDGPLPSKGSGSNRGSILGLLIALYEHRADHVNRSGSVIDSTSGEDGLGGARFLAADGLKWILRFVNALVDGADFSKAEQSASTGLVVSTNLVSNESGGAAWTINPQVKTTVSRMLQNLPSLWPKDDSQELNTNEESINTNNRETQKAAQMRILAHMKQRQAKFVASLGKGDESKFDRINSDVNEGIDLCIICRCDDADGENNGPLGYLGQIQRSRVLQLRSKAEASRNVHHSSKLFQMHRVIEKSGCQLRQSFDMDSMLIAVIPLGSLVTVVDEKISQEYGILSSRLSVLYKPLNGTKELEGWVNNQSSYGRYNLRPLSTSCYKNSRWGCTRPIIRQCGHAAHLNCVVTHLVSLHAKAASDTPYDGRFAANIEDGEFLCPLCKQLSNVLIPTEKHVIGYQSSQDASLKIPSKVCSSTFSEKLTSLKLSLMYSLNKEKSSQVNKKSVQHFGVNLLQAMQSSQADTNSQRLRSKKREWHSFLQGWDFKEYTFPTPGEPSMGNIISLLRQQHIAWAAAGHSAASAEASARGIQQIGFDPSTFDPWKNYNCSSRDTHPKVLEMRRSLIASSALLNILCEELDERYAICDSRTKSDKHNSTIGNLLCHIMEGSILTTATKSDCNQSTANDDWSVLTSLLSATPCHVSRDAMLSSRHEARAVASQMWAVKCLDVERKASSSTSKATKHLRSDVLPPMPYSVKCFSSFPVTSNLFQVSNPNDPSNIHRQRPFSPIVATSFLYLPLLSWDLNTLAGAMYSSLLSNCKSNTQHCLEGFVVSTHLLLVGRIVQVLVTPNSLDLVSRDNLNCIESDIDLSKEGSALAALKHHCHSKIKPNANTTHNISLSNESLTSAISLAILPFARSLVLLLRACMSVMRQMGILDKQETIPSSYLRFFNVLESDEAMFIEDGFYFLLEMGGPKPSEILSSNLRNTVKGTSSSWLELINCWLDATLSLESYHWSYENCQSNDIDSKGRKEISTYVNYEKKLCPLSLASKISSPVELKSDHDTDSIENVMDSVQTTETMPDNIVNVSNGVEEVSDENVFLNGRNRQGLINATEEASNATNFAFDFATEYDSDDEEMEDVDDADIHSVHDFIRNRSPSPVLWENPVPDSIVPLLEDTDLAQEQEEDISVEGVYCHGWDINKSSSSSEDTHFADLSHSSLIPYQSSFLGLQKLHPGPRGLQFDYASASSIMSDISHLGMVHSTDSQDSSGLIKLPKSFVELYGMVSRIKDDTHDEIDDNGNAETAICLITGVVMKSGPSRRRSRLSRQPGTCTLHARSIGSGTGIFFLLQKCTVLLMHNNKSAYSASLYVDENGEEDTSLRRGRPLFLKRDRFLSLENMWREHGVSREVAQIRSTSDRVIRDNWY